MALGTILARGSNPGRVDTMSDSGTPYFEALGDGHYQPTQHVQGAWNDDEQHLAPLTGIVIHEALRAIPRPDLQVARISVEVLGFLPLAHTKIHTEVVRPGRTIELIEAVATVCDRSVLRVRIWRLVPSDTSAIASLEHEPMPAPDAFPSGDFGWSGGFIESIQTRIDPARRPGRGRGWIFATHPLTDHDEISEVAKLLALADTANGLAPRLNPKEWMFPNVDLTIHLLRAPHGDWLGLDVRHEIGPNGVGMASTVLHDLDGPIGRITQILTVRTQPTRT